MKGGDRMLFHKNKCIVIAGCGPLGAALAKSLYKKGHKVVVLDKDRESFRYLPEEFKGYEMEGDPTDPQVLKAAGIEDAGLFIASTQDDNTNLLLAQIARQLNIRYRMGQWLPPKAFKDWNDCLLNRPMEPMISPHKEEREQNLSEQRNKGHKI